MKKYIFFFVSYLVFPQLHCQEFDGLWKSQGYGIFLEIENSTLNFYEYTTLGMLHGGSIPLDGNEIPEVGFLRLDDDFLIFETEADDFIKFASTIDFPTLISPGNDPKTNYDVFWHTINDWCALFPILNIDWDIEYQNNIGLIDSTTSDQELFTFISSSLQKLNDGHSLLLDEENTQVFIGGPQSTSLWLDHAQELEMLIEEKYIIESEFIQLLGGSLLYGTLNDNIGYLKLNSMTYGSDNELTDNDHLNSALDEVFFYLEDVDGLIIDIRNNGGGFDSNARLIANRLTKRPQLAYSKQARLQEEHNSFSALRDFYIEPKGLQFVDRPVVVLTGQNSVSAADIFAMMAKEIDCVTTMGTTSYGVFSNTELKTLPNGWTLSFSPERYLDINGINYEQKGIIPDIIVEESLDSLNEDIDNVLAFAIANISSNCNISSNPEESTTEQFVLYPNPTSKYVQLIFGNNDNHSITELSILNSLGQTVRTFDKPIQNATLDLENITPGLHYVKIRGEDTNILKLLIAN